MENEITNKDLKIIHKVVNYRTVKKEGFKAYRHDIYKKYSKVPMSGDTWDNFFDPGYEVVDKILFDENIDIGFPAYKWKKLINYIIICATSPINLAICLACFPVNILREAFYYAKKEEIDKLEELGLYQILKERTGIGYDNPELVEQNIIKDVEEMRKAK